MAVEWSYFDKNESINEKYLPQRGQGATMATQLVTAVNKLIYKWYNDGDVYDNTHWLMGWMNDLSSYANWIHKHYPQAAAVLDSIEDAKHDDEYEEILKSLADMVFVEDFLASENAKPAVDDIYNCDGPFLFKEYSYEED